MGLPHDAWLHLAQALPIGGQGRYPHRGDRTQRPNLVVSNHPDRWAAYCMSCKVGGVLFKTHVRVTGIAPPPRSTELSLPDDVVALGDLAEHVQRPVLRFLLSKHMDPMHFPGGLFYSDQRKRLMVPTAWGWLGRDTTENSPQKWLTYQRSQYLGDFNPEDSLVLVEDPFSYFKVRWALNGHSEFTAVSCVCTLGTYPRDSLFARTLGANLVGFFYDGDAAGERGSRQGCRRYQALGIRAISCCAPRGLDPKDLMGEQIRQHLKEHGIGL